MQQVKPRDFWPAFYMNSTSSAFLNNGVLSSLYDLFSLSGEVPFSWVIRPPPSDGLTLGQQLWAKARPSLWAKFWWGREFILACRSAIKFAHILSFWVIELQSLSKEFVHGCKNGQLKCSCTVCVSAVRLNISPLHSQNIGQTFLIDSVLKLLCIVFKCLLSIITLQW